MLQTGSKQLAQLGVCIAAEMGRRMPLFTWVTPLRAHWASISVFSSLSRRSCPASACRICTSACRASASCAS